VTASPATQPHRGARLGLPETGPGSIASVGRRIAALLVDAVACALVARLIASVLGLEGPTGALGSLVLFLEYTFFTGLFAQTLGMRLFGIACVRVRDGRPLGLVAAAVRALLLQLVIPAVVYDQDGRGLHDRAARPVMIRAGGPPAS